jgi:predicted RNA-binding Zn ribbon-like protein
MMQEMMTRNDIGLEGRSEFIFVADHLALDILNTVPRIDGELVDLLRSDADVLRWLIRVGWPMNESGAALRSGSLLHAMRALREAIRPLVERQKAGKRADVATFNDFLAKAQSHMVLVAEKSGGLHVKREWQERTAEQVLAPLAEAAAEFLVTADFELVRRCESDECVLWFYDRTKSHHRRWCSMATCGNRHKVAAFRRRVQERE